MSVLRPEQLERGAAMSFADLIDVRATLTAYRALLSLPAFVHSVDVSVLTKIATTDAMPVKERRRAAEMLATIRLKAMDRMAELSVAREQVLKALGMDVAAVKAQVLTHVNHVQVDARSVTLEADRESLRKLLADPRARTLAVALAARLDGGPTDDGQPPDPGAVHDAAALEAAERRGGEGGGDGGEAPGGDAPAAREERDVFGVDAGVAPQRLAEEAGDPGELRGGLRGGVGPEGEEPDRGAPGEPAREALGGLDGGEPLEHA